MGDPQSLKAEGNGYFKGGQFKEAQRSYTAALSAGDLLDGDKAVIYKNRAACRLKLSDHEGAVDDCTASLQLVENDPKALFRRCQAHDALGKADEAYKDVATLMRVDPKNTAVVPLYQKLHPIMQEKAKQQNSVQSKVSQMFNLAFDPAVAVDKRTQAFSNLMVLGREAAGSALICHQGGIGKLVTCLREKHPEVVVGALRVLACLVKNSKERAKAVLNALDFEYAVVLFGQGSKETTSAASHLVQMLFDWYAGLADYTAVVAETEAQKKKGERVRWPKLELNEDQQRFVDNVFHQLVKMIDSGKVTMEGRDTAMELILKNVTYKKGLQWTGKFLDTDGIERLLTVAGTQQIYKTLKVSDMSRMHAAAVLSTIYEDTVGDKQRDKFKDKCSYFLRELFGDANLDSKVEAVEIISTLLQGPFEVGSQLLGLEGVMQIMLTMAGSDNQHYQRVAVEAIVHSASKKNRCTGILKDAIPILKKLYQSADETIKVRALVGLCKLGSFSGGDISEQPMADGSTLYLSKICRKFLANTTKDCDLRKWATEGLAYLSLDAEVKEELADDTIALKAIFELAKMTERNMTYACVTVLVNVSNSYDTPDIPKEMLELAKFSQQHVRQEHELDNHEFIIGRIHKLATAGMTNALVALSGTDSQNCRELLCRVFMSMATVESLRGLLVQQGGVKALLHLMENNTAVGEVLAAQALAKIAVTLDPATAFPGQRIYEVVHPLITLLHNDCSGLQNFEALLSLTNLASNSESVRQRILSDKGLAAIERCQYEDHPMIRRAATECMCNMLMSDKVQERFEGDNDRVKIMVLFAGEEDFHIVRAAAGALAFMSSNTKLAEKIVEVSAWLQILQQILVTESTEVQHRACHLAMNLMAVSKDIATKLVESPVLEILMAITKLEGPELGEVRECAEAALKVAKDHGLIKPFDGQAGSLAQFREALQVKPLTITELREEEDEEEEEEKKQMEKECMKRYYDTPDNHTDNADADSDLYSDEEEVEGVKETAADDANWDKTGALEALRMLKEAAEGKKDGPTLDVIRNLTEAAEGKKGAGFLAEIQQGGDSVLEGKGSTAAGSPPSSSEGGVKKGGVVSSEGKKGGAEGKGSVGSTSEGKKAGVVSSEGKKVVGSSSEGKKGAAASSEGKKGGVSPSEGKQSAGSPAEGKKGGAASSEGKKGGVSPSEVKKGGAASSEGKKSGASQSEGKKGGASPSEGKKVGASPAKGKKASASPAEVKQSAAPPPSEGKKSAASPSKGKPVVSSPSEGKKSAAAPAKGKQSAAPPSEKKAGAASPGEKKPAAGPLSDSSPSADKGKAGQKSASKTQEKSSSSSTQGKKTESHSKDEKPSKDSAST